MDSAQDTSSTTPVLESTETDSAQVKEEASPVTDDQWRAMKLIVDVLYNHRESDGHDPSKVFHRKVNKRALPDYYDVIKEPIALSTLKAKLNTREYQSFSEFVRDCTLITHNAQTYNRPEAQAYQDALIIRSLVEAEFNTLVSRAIIEPEVAILPDLGEIPPADPQFVDLQEEEDEDDDDEDEDDEVDESDEDEGSKKRRKRGPRPSGAKRDGTKDDIRVGELSTKKKRGRPPRVDTPMESRIKAVLKGIRKPKNDVGQIMIHHFERLPDKSTMPEYFVEIKEPIAIELIKRKQKRKKYQSVDHFMRDMDIMFQNAKSYNTDESQIYKDAVALQREAHRLAEQEKKRPDTDFVMEEGRLPLPMGITHNGELWKVGDWIHIQNANDVTKPIVAQIYRTWQDTEGQKWVNACWYYRPEQTVHQYEKHFYPNEVVKTGQYRDHHVDEIVDRCFVMFFTRYSRGRPRGLPADKDVYVCEARYNEEKHKLNKIKTWASCLPDEVRDKDYEMDLFDGLRKEKKVPSPLLHLLEDAKETDELPKPRWGADNAPPIVGAVHRGSRDENQSPPPEPTPSPPPQPPLPPARQPSNMSNHEQPAYRKQSELSAAMEAATQAFVSAPTPAHVSHSQSSYPAQTVQQYHQHSVSPAPLSQPQNSQHSRSYTAQIQHSPFTQPAPSRSDSHSRYLHAQTANRNNSSTGDVNAAKQYEVYALSDTANAAIPDDIRRQFQQDEAGRVLFFTSPPLDVQKSIKPGEAIGHSVRYMAEKLRRAEALKEKRKADEIIYLEEEANRKRAKHEEAVDFTRDVEDLKIKALRVLTKQLEESTDSMWKRLYGEKWEEGRQLEVQYLEYSQSIHQGKVKQIEQGQKKAKERETVSQKKHGDYLNSIELCG